MNRRQAKRLACLRAAITLDRELSTMDWNNEGLTAEDRIRLEEAITEVVEELMRRSGHSPVGEWRVRQQHTAEEEDRARPIRR